MCTRLELSFRLCAHLLASRPNGQPPRERTALPLSLSVFFVALKRVGLPASSLPSIVLCLPAYVSNDDTDTHFLRWAVLLPSSRWIVLLRGWIVNQSWLLIRDPCAHMYQICLNHNELLRSHKCFFSMSGAHGKFCLQLMGLGIVGLS